MSLPKVSRAEAEAVEALIDQAAAAAARGAGDVAAALFHEVRRFAETPRRADAMARRVAAFGAPYVRERKAFAAMLAARAPAGDARRVAMFGDSLGLPRPGEPLDRVGGRPATYALAMQDSGRVGAVEPWFQRYGTSDLVLRLLDEADLRDAVVVIHVGLVDFSPRIFTENQRLSLDMLPEAVKGKILAFAQTRRNRRSIIETFDNYCYVPLPRWRENLRRIIRRCRLQGARRLILMPPIQAEGDVEAHTPQYFETYARYKEAMREEAARGAEFFDLDRFVWREGYGRIMLDDNMHIALEGHAAIAARLVELIAPRTGAASGARPAG